MTEKELVEKHAADIAIAMTKTFRLNAMFLDDLRKYFVTELSIFLYEFKTQNAEPQDQK